jgi:hypothetical protein
MWPFDTKDLPPQLPEPPPKPPMRVMTDGAGQFTVGVDDGGRIKLMFVGDDGSGQVISLTPAAARFISSAMVGLLKLLPCSAPPSSKETK